MKFRHLDYPADTPVEELGLAAIEALLDRGDIADWAALLRSIRADPWGRLALRVEHIIREAPMYGTSPAFTKFIAHCRRQLPRPDLAGARKRAKMSQAEVASRMGISQSDVSKIERGMDIRLSTLAAYSAALGLTLEVSLSGPNDPKVLRGSLCGIDSTVTRDEDRA